MSKTTRYSVVHQGKAWFVHLFTTTGAVLNLFAVQAVTQGAVRRAFILIGMAVLIDALDGTLARRFQVSQVIPGIDGSLLDNMIDFLSYTFVPAYFIIAGGWMAAPYSTAAAVAVLLSSAYQFCQSDAKTEDHYFTGFPCYWNIIVLYLYLLSPASWVSLTVLLVLTVMVFVPIKYIYPSRTKPLMKTTLTILTVWAASLIWVFVSRFDAPPLGFYLISLGTFVYYVAASLALTAKKGNK